MGIEVIIDGNTVDKEDSYLSTYRVTGTVTFPVDVRVIARGKKEAIEEAIFQENYNRAIEYKLDVKEQDY